MAALFYDRHRIVPTWRAAARHLLDRKDFGYEDLNLVLEIPNSSEITEEDRGLINAVDGALLASCEGLTVRTVAGTIFPLALYKQFGRPEFYTRYATMLKRGKKEHSWGTYAERMMTGRGKKGEAINPLEMLVTKLKAISSGTGNKYVSSYELRIAQPSEDLALPEEHDCGELPTYDPARDAKQLYGYPCLSHVSFKLIEGNTVNLTAVYRSHNYCARALGNLIGLSQLLRFVAKESDLAPGVLTCLSTHARLDVGAWGGIDSTRKLLG